MGKYFGAIRNQKSKKSNQNQNQRENKRAKTTQTPHRKHCILIAFLSTFWKTFYKVIFTKLFEVIKNRYKTRAIVWMLVKHSISLINNSSSTWQSIWYFFVFSIMHTRFILKIDNIRRNHIYLYSHQSH